jgi:hypothetical protein
MNMLIIEHAGIRRQARREWARPLQGTTAPFLFEGVTQDDRFFSVGTG